jgi:hypothetical protein
MTGVGNRPTILFLYNRPTDLDGRNPDFFRYAADIGFAPVAAAWRQLHVADNGTTSVRSGFALRPDGTKRWIRSWEEIVPRIIVHRMYVFGRAAEMLSWLSQAHPHAIVSYHPLWNVLDSKWDAELAFRCGALRGLDVARPRTYLVPTDAIATELAPLGRRERLIFKPAYGTQSLGIRLSSPATFDTVARGLGALGWSRFVVQELIENPVLYEGRRFDLRLYALLTNGARPRAHVYRDGVARLAGYEDDDPRAGPYARVMTGWSYLKRYRLPIDMRPSHEVLDALEARGHDAERVWTDIDALLTQALQCLVSHGELLHDESLHNRAFLLGADVMLTERDGGIAPLLIETNYVPGLTPWGRKIDARLEATHRGWLGDLWEAAHASNATRDVAVSTDAAIHMTRQRRRLTCALIDTSGRALTPWTRGVHPELVRMAHTLSRADAEIVMAPWFDVGIHDRSVVVERNALGFRDEIISAASRPIAPDIMLFHPASGSGQPDSQAERAALARLEAAGLGITGGDRNRVVSHLLDAASARGVTTNAAGVSGRWGRKDELEFALRAYTRHTGRRVSRPETYVVPERAVAGLLRRLAIDGRTWIVKPANRSRGQGIVCIKNADAWEAPGGGGDFVVQRLAERPVLTAGHKVDLRAYLLVDVGAPERSRRLTPVFVRLASAPYVAAEPQAEITNTSYRRRLGLPPAILPLDEVVALDPEVRKKLVSQLDALTAELLRAHAWWWDRHRPAREKTYGRRVLLWGIDVLPVWIGEELAALLLEVNVHPQLFRGVNRCDEAVERMLRVEYLPALRDATVPPAVEAC